MNGIYKRSLIDGNYRGGGAKGHDGDMNDGDMKKR